MILDEKKTTVAYRCPGCGAMVRSMIGAFTLSADMMRLKCPCGESDITIVYTPDKKLRLNVPCFFCPKPHNFLVSRNMFFGRELFTLPCAYSGLDICYIGEEKAVLKAAEEGEKELAELLGESTFDQLSSHRGGDFMTDPQIREIVKFVIQDLSDEGEISCNCEDGEGDYEAEIHDEEITVRCKKCGASAHIPANSFTAANDFLNAEHLDLH